MYCVNFLYYWQDSKLTCLFIDAFTGPSISGHDPNSPTDPDLGNTFQVGTISETSGSNYISLIYNCRSTSTVTWTGIAIHCSEILLLVSKPTEGLGTYHWSCSRTRTIFDKARTGQHHKGEDQSLNHQTCTFMLSCWLEISFSQGECNLRQANSHNQDHTGQNCLINGEVDDGLILLLSPLMGQFLWRLVAVMIDVHSIGQEDT